jgi:hypothetical protein
MVKILNDYTQTGLTQKNRCGYPNSLKAEYLIRPSSILISIFFVIMTEKCSNTITTVNLIQASIIRTTDPRKVLLFSMR